MKKIYYILGIVGLIIIIIAAWRLSQLEKTSFSGQTKMLGSDRDEHGCIGSAGYSWCDLKQKCLRSWEEACADDASSTIPVADGPVATFSDQALVLSPKQNEIVNSPLKIEGQALGTWFFEASLPVQLVDESGKLIASHYATAEGNWMTEKPVKFNSEIIFSTTATSGSLIISKDNPSALSENDASIKVPVRFK